MTEINEELSNDNNTEMSVFFHHLQTGIKEEEKISKSSINNVHRSGTERKPIHRRLKTDTTFRWKFLLTVWISLAFFGNGLISGQIGPSIPDLQLIVNEDLATISWLNTACAVGFATGSLIWGVLCERFDQVLITFLTTLVEAITNGVMPWCSAFPLMIVMRTLSCFSACGQVIAGSTLIITMWKKECAPYIQAIHFAFALGGIISPQIIRPFLAEPTLKNLTDTFNQFNVSRVDNTGYLTLNNSLGDNDCYNETKRDCIQLPLHGQVTYVQHGYLITSSLVVLCSIPLLASFFKNKNKFSGSTNEDKLKRKEHAENIPLKLKILILIFISVIFHCYVGIESSYVTYLMTFCLRHLKWSTADGSLASSLYWLGFSIGRFLGIFLTRLFQSSMLMLTFSIMMSLSFIGLFLGSLYHLRPVVFIFIIIVGFAFSPIFASVFSWTEERLFPVSGRITSLFLLSASTGMATVPIYLGYLMEHYTAMSFVYVMIGLSTFYLFVIMGSLIIARVLFPVRHISTESNIHDDTMYSAAREMESLYKINES
ncbi:hypothetical protein CHS0354_012189 [Potamilus streckersoni]|uniref:Major facilitator superfamily (MFS) profile domain-containing protein n=1 Tax=Potamilus streckersoni TaxID=2493646 RepID=A0AAE0VRP2_9BIVA|nr:hypothetical protein CHS0354_012189 [Potamilus streckersoni]